MSHPKRPLTAEEKESIERFERWLEVLFGRSVLSIWKAPVFSVKTHVDKYGNITISNGRMVLVPPFAEEQKWTIFGVDQDFTVSSNSLQDVLMLALNEAIRIHFVENH